MHNYAHHGEGHTIHSPLQLEAFGNTVDNCSHRLQRGTQQITTLDGHVIPLVLKSGLFYMSMYPPSDKELEEFPLPPVFEEGKTVDHHEQYSYDDHVDACLRVCKGEILVYKPCGILPFKPDFTKLRPYFGWAPVS